MAKKESKPGELPGGITQDQLDAWKKKYNQKGKDSVFCIQVPVDDKLNEDGSPANVASGWFRRPDMDVMQKANLHAGDPVTMGLVILNNCWLGGDPEIREDDEVQMSTITSLVSVFKIRQAVIKNF